MGAKETSLAFSINLHPAQYLLWGAEILFFFFGSLTVSVIFIAQKYYLHSKSIVISNFSQYTGPDPVGCVAVERGRELRRETSRASRA